MTTDTVHAAIYDLAAPVGLAQAADLPEAEGAEHLPDGATLWTAPYAHLLVWPVDSANSDGLIDAGRRAQHWFDLWLTRHEQLLGQGVIDGYLVLVLPNLPDEATIMEARKLEMATRVCRKHVVWPRMDSSEVTQWPQVSRITILGLPPSPESGVAAAFPELTDAQRDLWELLSQRSRSTVARLDTEGDQL